MKGYRDKDGFHIVLTDIEAMDLIILVSEGVKAIKQWDLSDKQIKEECVASAKSFNFKLGVIFVGDSYRNGGTTKEKPIEV